MRTWLRPRGMSRCRKKAEAALPGRATGADMGQAAPAAPRDGREAFRCLLSGVYSLFGFGSSAVVIPTYTVVPLSIWVGPSFTLRSEVNQSPRPQVAW